MKLLAIDTATEGCSAALVNDQQLLTRMEVQPRKHAELILPMLDELLSEAGLAISQLDALAFGRGPGAFTGVRIATGVIQGIAFGADLPVVPVSTLRALAQRAFQEYQHANVLTAFDARMDEVYWASYQLAENGLMRLQGVLKAHDKGVEDAAKAVEHAKKAGEPPPPPHEGLLDDRALKDAKSINSNFPPEVVSYYLYC